MEIYAINGGHKVRLTKSSIQNYIRLGYSIFTPYVPDGLSECGSAGSSVELKAEWNGEGLPPVGCRIEYTCTVPDVGHPAIESGKWYGGTIIAYHNECVWTSDNGIRHLRNTTFRPLRSEADRKRDEAASSIQSLFDSYNEDVGNDELARFGERLLQKIAAGKIPGIRIE